MKTFTSPSGSSSDKDVVELLGEPASSVWWRHPRILIAAALLVLAVLGGYVWKTWQKTSTVTGYITEPVSRGDLKLTVTANGTLQPTRSVSIGSELSGTVLRVLVDVNDHVKKGQVLVELDTAKLADQVLRSRATLSSNQAKVAQAAATVKESQANLARLEEVARLSGGKVPSKTELDTAYATLERAQSDEASARANVADAEAALSTDKTNLSKASIRSPINGVILTRSVDPGNAVAASLQAVTLFTIAEDLTQLKLQVNVDEADVGSVHVGQKASFTVSAYPRRKYPATITRVAFGSTITDNVVTYITYLDVDNTDLSLRPGMTATTTITTIERHNALLVPNTALRFTPSLPASVSGSTGGGIVASLMPRPPSSSTTRKPATGNGTTSAHQVWVLRDGVAVAVAVTPGSSDGRMTEVTDGELQAGMLVITDQVSTPQ